MITAAAAASLAHLHVVPAREHAVADIMVKHGAAEKAVEDNSEWLEQQS